MSTAGGLGGGEAKRLGEIEWLRVQVVWAEKDLERARRKLHDAEQALMKEQEQAQNKASREQHGD